MSFESRKDSEIEMKNCSRYDWCNRI